MSWLGGTGSGPPASSGADDAGMRRLGEWEAALASGGLPSFVQDRLQAASAGKAPWIATMTPIELGLARGKGIRPLAMVSGTCWYHYGYSWTRGHAEGWHLALGRLRAEALAVEANAVVDVKMRKIQLKVGDSMDYTVLGTAVRIDGLPKSTDPVIATVPALEFVRLLEAGIVPVGVAIGAEYDWLTPATMAAARALQGSLKFSNRALTDLGAFWERVRRQALRNLREDTQRLGDGVLAHTHFGQLLRFEGDDKVPPRFLGRHIVIGTVVHTRRSAANVSHDIRTVVDMAAGPSPLTTATPHGHNAYAEGGEKEEAI